jgi:hypothetical protein
VIGKRGISALLGLIVLIALGTLTQDFRFDRQLSNERAQATAVDRDLASIGRMVSDLRAAQAGYVATGQVPATWVTRTKELFDQIDRALQARKAAAPNGDAKTRYDAVLQAVNGLAAVDAKARAAIGQEDRLHASDLVYIDAQQAAESVTSELAAVKALEEQAASQRLSNLGTLRLAMNGLALVLVGISALYFGRAVSILSQSAPTSMAQMIRDLPPPVKTNAPAPAVATAQSTPAVPAPVARTISLSAAADLCVDLARVLDGRDVPALLERTAELLDAKGIMIWAVDTGGALLRPSACFGYPEKVLSKLRPLQVDADNVTSLAFRTMQVQSFAGASASDSGAIAVPLVTATGCVGVLAAEVRQSRPHPDVVPVAKIVAAQFSTLVAPSGDAAGKIAQG